MKKIIVFGAGKIAHFAIKRLSRDYKIIAIIDNNKDLWGKSIDSFSILSPDDILTTEFDYIVIACRCWKEILKQLVADYRIKNALLYQESRVEVIENNGDDERYILRPIYGGEFCDGLIVSRIDSSNDFLMRKRNSAESSKHIMVLAYYFPPLGSSPIQRTLKFVKYLAEMDFQITVVTVDENAGGIKDESLINEIPKNVRVLRFHDQYKEKEYIQTEARQKIFNLLYLDDCQDSFADELNSVQKSQDLYVLPDKLVLWAVDVFDHIEQQVDMSKIDVLYSTVPEWSPHFLAYKLKRKYHIPWIADYRDPWVASKVYAEAVYSYMVPDEILFDQKLERLLVLDMDAMIVAGESWKSLYISAYDIKPDRIHIISNGYDEADFEGLTIRNKKNDKFTLCYNGSLGYNRKPRYALETISELIDEGIIDKKRIRWIFNGPLPKWMYESEIEPFDRYCIVQNNQMLSHRESIQIAMDSDILVMYGEIGEMAKLNYPAKFYEYLRIGRPIICFSTPGSPQDLILRETRAGKNYDLKDKDGMREYLIEAYDNWNRSEEIISQNMNQITLYDRKTLTNKLANVIHQLVSE